MGENRILLADSYKATHWLQYPPGTERVYSYFESRGGLFDEIVFFGLQYVLERYLAGTVVTRAHIEEADVFFGAHFGNPDLFHRRGWEHIVDAHGGRLPVVIRAVPEGTAVPTRNVLFTIENTDPECFWLTSYLETLLVQVWYGCTVATLSREMKRLIGSYLEETGDPAGLEMKLQDFGFRGVSSVESAAIGGAAHLVNFQGTDNVVGALFAKEYYGADMAGFSIPAAEHSTQTAWGREAEEAAFAHMLTTFPAGLVAVVSDSWDVRNACRNLWGDRLRDRVLEREGTLVVRPDSGDPHRMVLDVLEILGERFGTVLNPKGYKLLPPQVAVIQGDGIDYDETVRILTTLRKNGWSTENITLGMGGALLQRLDRDTQSFAFKCSEVVISGEPREVYKDPVTDPAKASKRGRLALIRDEDGLRTVPATDPRPDELVEVFRDGEVRLRHSWSDVRERASLPEFVRS
ncbi:MAG: nicotinate phosphoribosyltransferase [Candidatus Binatia bacterium]|nr:nicotinate phosphoribosyltransferase [Candidatus Binatia bacterium]